MKIAQNISSNLTSWVQNLQEFQLDSIFETTILGRAYDYVPKVTVLNSDEDNISCQISGTTLYDINLKKVGRDIIASCNCPHDKKCKHIAAVILSMIKIDWDSI